VENMLRETPCDLIILKPRTEMIIISTREEVFRFLATSEKGITGDEAISG